MWMARHVITRTATSTNAGPIANATSRIRRVDARSSERTIATWAAAQTITEAQKRIRARVGGTVGTTRGEGADPRKLTGAKGWVNYEMRPSAIGARTLAY